MNSRPPIAPPRYQAPKPKKRPTWAIILGLGGVGVCGVGGLVVLGSFVLKAPSNVHIDGKQLSNEEVARGAIEVARMTAPMENGNPSKLDTTIDATTPLSKKFRASILAIRDSEKEMKGTSDQMKIDKPLTLLLGQKDDRDKGTQEFKKIDLAFKKYFDTEIKSSKDLLDIAKQLNADQDGKIAVLVTKMEKMRDAYDRSKTSRANLSEFMSYTPHQTNSKGNPVFYTQDSINRFKGFMDAYIADLKQLKGDK